MRQLCDEAINSDKALDTVGRCRRAGRCYNLTVLPNPRERFGCGTAYQVHDREHMETLLDVWHGGLLVRALVSYVTSLSVRSLSLGTHRGRSTISWGTYIPQ